ncbi:hypothetical protein [Posidoniimonas polymericola]|uniref:hypothetical protein n=1 Tax=Posidoniimonas polymericola TaxID=2528002 RepID=UPI0011B51F6E|nr:hypothetical protein [Posidoniimonas polymericola]
MPDPADNTPRQDGDPIANLIGGAMAAPGMPADLQARLSLRMEQEFADANDPIRAAQQGSLSALLEKKYELVGSDTPPAVERGEISRLRAELHDLAAPPERRMGIHRRLALVGAAAAVLLVCLWNQPGFRWTEVVDAVRHEPSVRLVGQHSPAEPLTIATRRDQTGRNRPTTASYLNISGTVMRQLGGEEGSKLLPTARRAELVGAEIAAALFDLAGLPDNGATIEVGQSWPRSVADGIEVDLQLTQGVTRLPATILIDASTKLPQRVVLRPATAAEQIVLFCYSPGSSDE